MCRPAGIRGATFGAEPTRRREILLGERFSTSGFQGVEFRRSGDPVLFLSNPEGVTRDTRRQSLDALRYLNARHQIDAGDPEIASRIEAYEMAFRMQTSVPELADISKETAAVHEMYGTSPGEASFANNCLLARRQQTVVS